MRIGRTFGEAKSAFCFAASKTFVSIFSAAVRELSAETPPAHTLRLVVGAVGVFAWRELDVSAPVVSPESLERISRSKRSAHQVFSFSFASVRIEYATFRSSILPFKRTALRSWSIDGLNK